MTSDELRAAANRVITFYKAASEIMPMFGDSQLAPEPEPDSVKLARAYLAEHPADEPSIRWTDEQCFKLNAHQHNSMFHPYTCGNDSRHRPLIATRHGWRCADCDYRQDWAHK